MPTNKTIFTQFKQSKILLIGCSFILLCAVLSTFAYVFIPDNSRDANRQIPELALANPLESYDILRTPKRLDEDPTWSIDDYIFGKKEQFIYTPISDYQLHKEHISITTTIGRNQEIPKAVFGYSQRVHIKDKDAFREKYIYNHTFLLGSDRYGRDILSRLILGIRVSLLVGLLAVFISVIVGLVLGSTAGYFGGYWDRFVMLLINTSWSIPTLLMVFAIVLAMGRGLSVIFLAVGLTMWVDVARIVRGQVMQLREEQFVLAANSLAYSHTRIIIKHILPNLVAPVLVVAASNFAMAILIEAGLSYLGFGIKPPSPSLGVLLNENYGYAISGQPLLALFPALMIMMLVLAFNLVGTGLRDVFDIKQR